MIGIFMNQVMQGQPMSIFGDGSQTRAFSYIADVAPVITRAIETPAALNQVFNVGADISYTVTELAQVVAEAMGVPAQIAYLAARNEVKRAYSSHDKVRQVFGRAEAVPLAEGIGRMAAWARRVGARHSSVFEAVEIARGLPPSWAAVLK